MAYTQKDRQDIAQDGGAGPDDSPATPEQSIEDVFRQVAAIEVHAVIELLDVEIYTEDYEHRLMTFSKTFATPEAIYLAATAWRVAHEKGCELGKRIAQHDMRRALGL